MHDFLPFYGPAYPPFVGVLLPFLIVAAVWTVILKGFALWHAARHSQKWWFIALLLINTLGILEIVYLVWFRPTSPYARHSHTPAHDSSAQA